MKSFYRTTIKKFSKMQVTLRMPRLIAFTVVNKNSNVRTEGHLKSHALAEEWKNMNKIKF